jgi:tetratricopeptide (TPR) repeat protein
MPRDGDTPLARFAHAIAVGDGFSLGAPVLSDDGSTVTVPVLQTRARERRYVLAQEVSDLISAVDPGQLDRLRVRNATASRVLLLPGSLFEGKKTPSRATTAGAFLEPKSEAEIEVKCVHASQSITTGAVLPLADALAPAAVRQALLARDQGWVWTSVDQAVAAQQGSSSVVSTVESESQASDDLLAGAAASSPNHLGRETMPPGTASDTRQCGVAILDAGGVVVLEIFDSPTSWRVASPLIRKQRTDPIQPNRRSPLIVGLIPQRASEAAREFLTRIGEVEHRRVTPHSAVAPDSMSEYTDLDGEIVHLIAFGRLDSRREPAAEAPGLSLAGFPAHGDSDRGIADSPLANAAPIALDGDVAVAQGPAVDLEDEPEPRGSGNRPRRRKVLTSGWDASTFESLERYSRKEFGGDRSAAMRFLVRQGLGRRGYMGPRPQRPAPAILPSAEPEAATLRGEMGRATLESRIQDYERIAQTDAYAGWLRTRARVELERLAEDEADELLRAAAQSALERLPSPVPLPETPPPIEEEPLLPPPVDVRPLLRRAFLASAGGRYADALALFDKVLDAEPDNRTALLGRAVALRRSGKGPEALAALDLVLGLEPLNAAALLNRGRVLQERGDFPGALETFDRLAAVAPNDWDVWMARGDVLARMGQDREALGAYSEALRRNPDDEGLKTRIRALERIRLAPAPAPLPRVALPRDVQGGQSYLVKEGKVDLSYRVFRMLAGRKLPSLVITHQAPEMVRAEQGLLDVPILELSHAAGVDRIAPTSLAVLTKTIERFVEDHRGHAAILLDGLGMLVANNGTRDTVLFLERVNEAILPSQSVFLISVTPGDLGEKETAILERDLRVLS